MTVAHIFQNLRFEWDSAKATRVQAKHGVAFEEAATIFGDENALLCDDPDHSTEENRYVLLGMSATGRLLVVVHCLRDSGTVFRLISARRATAKEGRQYLEKSALC